MQPDRYQRSGTFVWSLLLFALLTLNIIIAPIISSGGKVVDDSTFSVQDLSPRSRSSPYRSHVEVFADPEKFVMNSEGMYYIDFIFEEYCGNAADIDSIEAKILDPYGNLVLDLPDRTLSDIEIPAGSNTVYEYKFFIKENKIAALRNMGLTRFELIVKFTGRSRYGSSFETEINIPSEVESRIALVVNSNIYSGIKDSLEQYQKDIKSRFSATFFLHNGTWNTPSSLRDLLIDEWEENQITGAILIGDMPYAIWEYVRPNETESFPIPIFYEDLDGSFSDVDSNGWYDRHYWGENDGPEIWVSNWFMPLKTIPSINLCPWGTGVTGGLKGHYYNDTSMTDLVATRIDPILDLNFNQTLIPPRIDTEQLSAKWTGSIIVNRTENIEFKIEVSGGARLYIDNFLLIDHKFGSTYRTNSFTATRSLTSGQHDILIEFYKWEDFSNRNGTLFLGWDSTQVKINSYNDYLKKTHLYHTGELGQPKSGLLFMDYPYGYKCKMLEPVRDLYLYPLYGESLVVGGGRNETTAWEFLNAYEPGYELLSVWSHAAGWFQQFQTPKDSGYPVTNARYEDIRGMNGSTITIIWGCHAADFGDTGYVWSTDIDQNVAINYAFNTKFGLVSTGCTRSYGTSYRETYISLKNRSTVGDGYFGFKDYSYNETLRSQTNPEVYADRWIDDEALFGDPFVTSDNIPGDLSVTINNGNKFATDPSVILHLYSNNPGEMSLRNEGGDWTDWMPFVPKMEWNLSIELNYGKVYFRMRNSFGMCWNEVSATVGYDTHPPGLVTVTINDGALWTNTTLVTLNINAEDLLSGLDKIRLSRDGSSWTSWREFSPVISWDLGTGDGQKEVFIEVKDRAGLTSNVVSASIDLDTATPTTEIVIEGKIGENEWYTSGVEITLSTPGDENTEIFYQGDVGNINLYFSPLLFLEEGPHSLSYWAEDLAGNMEPVRSLDFRIDREDPSCLDLTINDGAQYTNSREVSLQIETYDATSGCSEICIRSDGSNWGEWIDHGTKISYELEGEEGLKIVEVRIRDEAGNEMEEIINASIILDLTSPVLIDPIPFPDQTNVSLDSWIVVHFDEEVLFDPAEGDVIMVFEVGGGRIWGEVDFWNLSSIASFQPNEPLKPFHQYEVMINSDVMDRAGNYIGPDNIYTFSTVGAPPPIVDDFLAALEEPNVILFWSEPENKENIPIDGYRIFRSSGDLEELIYEGGPDESSYTDRSAEQGKVYFYSIVSFNDHGESNRGLEIRIEIPEPPEEEPIPEEPSDDDDDEEPIIEDKEKGESNSLAIVITVMVILILLAGIGAVGVFVYIRGRKNSEENYLEVTEEELKE